MELDTIKQTTFQLFGWVSVITGILALALLNISLLSDYNTSFTSQMSYWIMAILVLGGIALFNKNSRSLGLWGIGIGGFLGIFITLIFFLGWAIVPFP